MKKTFITTVSSLLVSALLVTGAFAASDSNNHGNSSKHESKQSVQSEKKDNKENKGNKENKENKDKKEDKDNKGEIKIKIETSQQQSVTSVTYNTYDNGHKGYNGLLNAYKNVKDKPSGKVIAKLLEQKYNISVTEATYALNQTVADLLQKGDLTAAVEIQKAVIKVNVKDIASYKKYGTLKIKSGKKGITAFVNGNEVNFSADPYMKNNSTLVPFRAIAEALDAKVQWDQATRTVLVVKASITVKLVIGQTTAAVNGQQVQLPAAGEVTNGNTMVPIRFLSQALNAQVVWDATSQTVIVYDAADQQ